MWPLEIECSTTLDRAIRSKNLRSRNREVYFRPRPFPLPHPLPWGVSFFVPSWDLCVCVIAPLAWFRALMLGMSKQLCWTTEKSIFLSEFDVDCVSSILAMRAETAMHWPRVNHTLSFVGRPTDFVWSSPIFFKCLESSVYPNVGAENADVRAVELWPPLSPPCCKSHSFEREKPSDYQVGRKRWPMSHGKWRAKQVQKVIEFVVGTDWKDNVFALQKTPQSLHHSNNWHWNRKCQWTRKNLILTHCNSRGCWVASLEVTPTASEAGKRPPP